MAIGTLGTAFVDVRPDLKGFNKDLGKQLNSAAPTAKAGGEKAAKGFGGAFGKLGGVLAGAFAVGTVTKFATDAIDAASSVGEATSKVSVVFGKEFGPAIEEFASGAAKNLGISKLAALEATGTFGNLFRSMGLGQGIAASLSRGIVGVSSDLASFNNADPTEVLDAMRAGLTGETEPLKRFGININAARVEAEALRLGLVKAPVDMVKVQSATTALADAQAKAAAATKEHGAESLEARKAQAAVARAEQQVTKAMAGTKVELTAAQKAQATYALVMQDTKLAQGDFERTSNGLANRQRILKAQFEDQKAALGQKLLPIYTSFVTFLSTKALPAIVSLAGWIGRNKDAVIAIAGPLVTFLAVFKAVKFVKAFATGVQALNAALLANPAVLIAAAIAGLVVGIVIAYKKFKPFRDVVDAVGRALTALPGIILGALRAAWSWITTQLQRAVDLWLAVFVRFPMRVVGALVNFGRTLWGGIQGGLGFLRDMLARIVDAYITIYVRIPRRIIGAIANLGQRVWQGVVGGLRFLRDMFGRIVDGYVTIYVRLPARVIGAIGNLGLKVWRAIAGGLTTLVGNVRGVVGDIVGFFTGLPGRIRDTIARIGGAALAVGKAIIKKLAEGVSNIVRSAVDFGSAIADAVKRVLNGIIRTLNDLFDFKLKGPGPLPDLHVNLPDIPTFARGGVVTRPTLALLGETARARPEIATPERLLRQIMREETGARTSAGMVNNFYGIPDSRTAVGELSWMLRTRGR